MCVFVAFDIQHAMRLCHSVVCDLAGSTVFFTFSHIRHNFREKVFEKCLNFATTSSETFLILTRTERDNIINVYRSSCKVSVILVRF